MGAPTRVLHELAQLWARRELLYILVRRDLKVRYKNSRLGFLWSVAPALMQVAVITFVFTRATTFASDFPSYSAYVLAAMIPWTYFSTALQDSSQSVLHMMPVIKKVALPREVIPLAGAISNFIHFMLSWVLFFVYWWGIMRAPIQSTTPIILYVCIIQFMLVTGLCFVVSALNVFFEDVKYILTILLQIAYFLLPILYLEEGFGFGRAGDAWYRSWVVTLYHLNPIAIMLTAYRKALLQPPSHKYLVDHGISQYSPLDPAALAWAGIFSFAVLVWGYWYFNRRKWQFVERP